ncbi:MAG: NAD-dependent epimerase/dehydratase family protein [Alphaproteobacteria bacterium]|nr:NAD-dependent epimerase/dehydratase family protein [Alphaproteobacteria bacterium]
MKQVTVFGGAGFIGRHLVARLAAQGIAVRVAVRDAAGAGFLRPMGDVGQITPVRANITNNDDVAAAVDGVDAVVNLVGILFSRGRQGFEAIHRDGAARIARKSKEAGVERLLHMSALGASLRSPSRYAWSKAAGEEAVREAFEGATIVRPSVVFGPDDDFFNRFAALARLLPALPVFGCPMPSFHDGAIDIYGDGGTKFQPVYVGDVADAMVTCFQRRDAVGKTYELGGPAVYSFKALMDLVLQVTDRKCLLMPVPFWVASFQALFLELLPTPPLTRDQVTLLKSDNIVTGELPTLESLDVTPTAAEVILPTYLDRFRRGGRFHGAQPA